MKHFVFGFITAAIVISAAVWLGRQEIVKWAAVGYEPVDRPAMLLVNVELRQNGKEVGKLSKGAPVFVKGRAKDSPMEYFSISAGWENRGVEADKVYRILSKNEAAFVEIVIPPQ
jgi:hypothetical protein